MKIVTPPLRRFQQHCQRKNGWSDHYGALHSAAQYAGLEIPAQFEFNGFWQHGSFGSWSKRVPSTLVYNLEPAAFPFLVARVDEQLCLMEDGYKDVRAIGLPILYTPGLAPKRVPRSLLVVPTHTLLGATYPDRSVFEAYANEIAAIAGDFEHVVICVHPHCKTNGFWVNEFSSRGFPIIYGAQTDDRNALLRMRTLFEQFEYVTTNGWGSHIPYALAYGAKVSLHGPEPALRAENLLKDGTWRKNLEALRKASSPEVFAERRQFLERFSRCPGEGIADIEVGRYALGWANKLAPEQMRALLLELLGPTPKPMAQVSLDLEHAFLADSSNFKACFGLAANALTTQRPVEALSLFDHAASLAPRNPAVHLGRAVALARLKDVAASETASRLALELKPDSVDALRLLARLCRSGGRTDEGTQFYERILLLRPNDPDALANVGMVTSAANSPERH